MTDMCSCELPSQSSTQTTKDNLCCDEYNISTTGDCNTTIADGDVVHEKKSQTKCILSLYTCPPKGEFPLEKLYACTKQRYRLLQILSDIGDCEMASKQTWIPTFIDKLLSENIEEFRQIVLNDFADESVGFLMEWDVVSHFAMRTACSRLFESLKWLLKQEIKLFHIRWYLMNAPQRELFMGKNGITLNRVSKDERLALFAKFQDASLINDLYKTRFCRASQLVKTRTVYLLGGWAYFKADQAVYPIANLYEEYLNKSLRRAKAKYHFYDFDSKYSFFFRRISEEIKLSLFKFSPCSKSRVEIKNLDGLSLTSYPLCMSNLHYFLKKQSHLRNGGRFQYNLFLKGIGLTLFDAIKFWRDIFTKKISLENFTQHYLYSIRHNYGKLGKQADYPPLSCARILDASPGPLDRHGCPFQKSDKKELYLQLKRYGLSDEVMGDVWTLVENNVPQQACARVFELKHGVTDQQATAHPNIYYSKSRAIIEKKSLELQKPLEKQSDDLKPLDNQSIYKKPQGNQSNDLKLSKNNLVGLKPQENQSLNTKIQVNQSVDINNQENRSLDTKIQVNQSVDIKNQSLDTKIQVNQSVDIKTQENQSLDNKHIENQSHYSKPQEEQFFHSNLKGENSICLKSGKKPFKISNLDDMLESKRIKTDFCPNCSCTIQTFPTSCLSQVNKLEW